MEAGKPCLFSTDLDQASELDARANRKALGRNNHCRPRFLLDKDIFFLVVVIFEVIG